MLLHIPGTIEEEKNYPLESRMFIFFFAFIHNWKNQHARKVALKENKSTRKDSNVLQGI